MSASPRKDVLGRNLQLVNQLAKLVVADRFKRMARDEVLSRFIQSSVDPVLLVDLNLRVDRESIHLAEMSLLSLVTAERMSAEIKRTAVSIQRSYQEVYGEDSKMVKDFASPELVHLRTDCLRARVEFYKCFLVVHDTVSTIFELAVKAFNKAERFQSKLEPVINADRRYNDELVRETETTQRFLMRKQTDYEILKAEELWLEFKTQSFKEPQALP